MKKMVEKLMIERGAGQPRKENCRYFRRRSPNGLEGLEKGGGQSEQRRLLIEAMIERRLVREENADPKSTETATARV